MTRTIVTQTPVDRKARTYEATIRNIFAAKERHDRSFEAMVAKSQAADKSFDWDTGLLLAA